MSKTQVKAKLKIKAAQVGPWGLNAYALVCSETRQSALIDPGADPEALEALLAKSVPIAIILTHTHSDHTGALTDMRRRMRVPLMVHPGSAAVNAHLDAEKWLAHGDLIHIGNQRVKVCHTPGHCEDQISLLNERHHYAVVGDTIFEGGPGKTWSEQTFRMTLKTLQNVVLSWPRETVCYPGHGNSFRLGDIRRDIEAFIAKDHGGFFGDATWDM